MQKVYLSRKIYFSSAHRYHNPEWSDQKNKDVFGPCNNPHGHGHNYELEVTIHGAIDEQNGMVMNLTDLDRILREKIMSHLDHRFLDREVDFFKSRVPTTENIAHYCWQQLEAEFNEPNKLFKLKLYENPELFVEYYGETSHT